MRYLIIDTEKIDEDSSEMVWFRELQQSYDRPILSEEESMLMFKDIWFRAQANSDENTAFLYDGLSEDERETMSWDEFKETHLCIQKNNY